ncbi:hypothetical protein BD410DRAFT_585955 [Rickenella mellea]|uniref:Uncharacterized protein n=1 Tax=Rickenella mellea TaxID=50990 RepID=A0A4Y7PR12_9AGAM|nr:hypothetical protein BD410DRAFT_585955 [Rickenella mellea]
MLLTGRHDLNSFLPLGTETRLIIDMIAFQEYTQQRIDHHHHTDRSSVKLLSLTLS